MTTSESGIKVHATANVSPEATIGDGTSIWHHAQVRERARIGRDCILGKGVYVDADVTIGDRCKLQNGAFVYHPASLADGVFLGPGVIVTNDMLPRAVNPDMSLKTEADWLAVPVVIQQGASVGAGSVLLPGVTIGRWAMIGANSVVTRDVPDHGLALGNPARIVGYVCRCGKNIAPQDGANSFKCPACGSRLDTRGFEP